MKANKGDTITINKPGHLIDGIKTTIIDIDPEKDRPVKINAGIDWSLTWDEIIPSKQAVGDTINSERYSDTPKQNKSLVGQSLHAKTASGEASTMIKTIDKLPFETETKKRGRPKVNKPEADIPKRGYNRKVKS